MQIGVSAIKVNLCHVTRILETVCARKDGQVQDARAGDEQNVEKIRTVMMTTVCALMGFSRNRPTAQVIWLIIGKFSYMYIFFYQK